MGGDGVFQPPPTFDVTMRVYIRECNTFSQGQLIEKQ